MKHIIPRRALPALALGLVAATGLVLPAPANADAAAPALGNARPAPDFTLPSAGGKSLSLSQYKGQVVMINFWATWCGPCRQEMPLLDAMYRKYKGMGFTLIGVNVEPDTAAAEKFLKELPVSFPVAFDADSKVSKLYDVKGMPSTVIVDRKGNARVLHRGYRPGDENTYLDHVRTLIRE
ncbi:MAG: TlpA family protein disulfide reductase [Steroidobacteraceae bacterium]|nr:TlpA family protein disulfide reductase [Steroidobacteraceae bacterium]